MAEDKLMIEIKDFVSHDNQYTWEMRVVKESLFNSTVILHDKYKTNPDGCGIYTESGKEIAAPKDFSLNKTSTKQMKIRNYFRKKIKGVRNEKVEQRKARRLEAIRLRSEKRTLREIGEILGISGDASPQSMGAACSL